jgi:hypothetical protein
MSSVRVLTQKIGEDGMAGLHIVVDNAGLKWKDDVLAITGERFERRLAQEMAAVRVDMAKEFALVRVDMAKECAAVRSEAAANVSSILKWSFLFWIGQVGAMSAMLAFLLRALGPR